MPTCLKCKQEVRVKDMYWDDVEGDGNWVCRNCVDEIVKDWILLLP